LRPPPRCAIEAVGMTGIDLSSLNPSERSVLLLLAEGHTAKSIANLTGRSVGAVNERLREARRKTGVGSSRELARLFAQENRHEEVGVVTSKPGLPEQETSGAHQSGRLVAGMFLVMLSFFAAAALLFALHQAQTANPDVGGPPGTSNDAPRMLEDRLRVEARDGVWASRMETTLRARYAAISGLAHDQSLRVTCAKTVCRVIGRSIPGGDESDQNKIMAALQDATLHPDSAPPGLENASNSFGAAGTKQAPGFFFEACWTRKP
jgi:DNA-binding CsgD family transcriptional regulator